MNCKHIQESGIKQDGEYNLIVMWPNDKRSGKLYCADMASKTPLEYVTLPAGKGNNFARYYQKQTHEKQETMFTKVNQLYLYPKLKFTARAKFDSKMFP